MMANKPYRFLKPVRFNYYNEYALFIPFGKQTPLMQKNYETRI